MSLFLVIFGRIDAVALTHMIDDLRIAPGDAIDEWRSTSDDLRIIQSVPHAPTKSTGHIVSRADCTAAVDGWIGDIDCRGAPAASRALDAYLRWGPHAISKLDGEFAFALHDGNARELLVGCDVMGTRGPAWITDESCVVVASRALSTQLHPAARRRWNRRYFAHVLSGVFSAPIEITAFEGVRRVVPGSTLRWELSGRRPKVSEVSLERLRASAPLRTRRDADEALREAIDDATSRRLGTEPFALAVSGGLDSAVVAAAIARRQRRFDAFAMTDATDSATERTLDTLARAVPVMNLRRVDVGASYGLDPDGVVPDDPIVGAPALQVARVELCRIVAARETKSLLNGEGGDELFEIAWRSPKILGAMGPVSAARYLRSQPSWRSMTLAACEAFNLPGALHRALFLPRVRAMAAAAPWLAKSFLASPDFEAVCEHLYAVRLLDVGHARTTLVINAMQRNYLAQSLMHMAAGLEQRSPFLDRALASTIASLPAELVMGGPPQKRALRFVASHRLPRELAWRPKKERLEVDLCVRALSVDAVVRESLREVEQLDALRDIVDVGSFRRALVEANPLPRSLRERAFRILFVARWATRVARRYGVAQ